MNVVVASGQRGGDRFDDNWWIAAPAAAALGFIVAALVAGTIGIVRDEERSLAVLGTVAIGALVVLFVVGEVVLPH